LGSENDNCGFGPDAEELRTTKGRAAALSLQGKFGWAGLRTKDKPPTRRGPSSPRSGRRLGSQARVNEAHASSVRHHPVGEHGLHRPTRRSVLCRGLALACAGLALGAGRPRRRQAQPTLCIPGSAVRQLRSRYSRRLGRHAERGGPCGRASPHRPLHCRALCAHRSAGR